VQRGRLGLGGLRVKALVAEGHGMLLASPGSRGRGSPRNSCWDSPQEEASCWSQPGVGLDRLS